MDSEKSGYPIGPSIFSELSEKNKIRAIGAILRAGHAFAEAPRFGPIFPGTLLGDPGVPRPLKKILAFFISELPRFQFLWQSDHWRGLGTLPKLLPRLGSTLSATVFIWK